MISELTFSLAVPLLSADRLADALDHMPDERAVLGLFCDLILAADLGTGVGDVGCGSGRLERYLAARGLTSTLPTCASCPSGKLAWPGWSAARVVRPGGYLLTAFKAGDGQVRRGGRATGLGVEFDVY
jgi:hypothetical protein